MKTLPTLLALFLLTTLSACQLYRNNGRNMFESASPGHVNPNTGFQTQNCWQQPSTEPIFQEDLSKSYTVTSVNDQIIEVCIENHISGF